MSLGKRHAIRKQLTTCQAGRQEEKSAEKERLHLLHFFRFTEVCVVYDNDKGTFRRAAQEQTDKNVLPRE